MPSPLPVDDLPSWLTGLLWTLCVGAAASGALLLVRGHRRILRAEESAGWPRVPGRVVRNERLEDAPDGPGPVQVDIAYRYTVAGIELEGSRVDFAPSTMPRLRVRGRDRRLRRRYPVGARVTVAYDPRRPADAVLQAGPRSSTWWPLAAGLGLVLSGVAGALLLATSH